MVERAIELIVFIVELGQQGVRPVEVRPKDDGLFQGGKGLSVTSGGKLGQDGLPALLARLPGQANIGFPQQEEGAGVVGIGAQRPAGGPHGQQQRLGRATIVRRHEPGGERLRRLAANPRPQAAGEQRRQMEAHGEGARGPRRFASQTRSDQARSLGQQPLLRQFLLLLFGRQVEDDQIEGRLASIRGVLVAGAPESVERPRRLRHGRGGLRRDSIRRGMVGRLAKIEGFPGEGGLTPPDDSAPERRPNSAAAPSTSSSSQSCPSRSKQRKAWSVRLASGSYRRIRSIRWASSKDPSSPAGPEPSGWSRQRRICTKSSAVRSKRGQRESRKPFSEGQNQAR